MTPLQMAAPLVGVPYAHRGRSPRTGWDCLGCARHVREHIFGRPWHSDGVEYGPLEAMIPGTRADMIAGRLGDWTFLGDKLADMRPGAILLFQYFGAPSHVGCALTDREFIHCVGGSETVIVDFDRETQWERRLRGIYD